MARHDAFQVLMPDSKGREYVFYFHNAGHWRRFYWATTESFPFEGNQ